MTEARRFLFQLKKDIQIQYGINVDLFLIVNETLNKMSVMNQFSEEEMATARLFYAELLKPQEKLFFSLKIFENRSKSSELVLPDKMASGFMFMLGGAILCVLPFGITQAIGTGFIVTGAAIIVDGAYSGEKPYHVDSETGHVTPINFAEQNSSIGIGTQF